jgi:ABC-type multidrug transport system fused ATPase/permease subunit
MSTAAMIWRLIRYRPWLYSVNVVLWSSHYLLPLIPGLLIRGVLDALSGERSAAEGQVWTFLALLLGVGVARMAVLMWGVMASNEERFSTSTLVRWNLLSGILDLPGARALVEPAGATLSRFRDDAKEIEDIIDWLLDVVGQSLFAVVALIIMFSISPTITLASRRGSRSSRSCRWWPSCTWRTSAAPISSACASPVATLPAESPAPLAKSSRRSRQFSSRKPKHTPSRTFGASIASDATPPCAT